MNLFGVVVADWGGEADGGVRRLFNRNSSLRDCGDLVVERDRVAVDGPGLLARWSVLQAGDMGFVGRAFCYGEVDVEEGVEAELADQLVHLVVGVVERSEVGKKPLDDLAAAVVGCADDGSVEVADDANTVRIGLFGVLDLAVQFKGCSWHGGEPEGDVVLLGGDLDVGERSV